MAEKYHISQYTPRHRRQVAELQTHLWGPNVERNLKYLEWKYEANPYFDKPLIYLAMRGDELIGMRGFLGTRWQVDAEEFPIPCAGDLVVLPEHRNRGLFRALMVAAVEDLANKGHKYLFSLSASRATHLGQLTMGWHGIGPIQPRSRERYRALLPAFIRKSRKLVGIPPTPFTGFDRRSRRGDHPGIFGSRSPETDIMAGLIERIGTDGRIRHIRDQAYFEWRFKNPLWQYRFLFLEEGELAGYLVLGARRGTWHVHILDWEATNEEVRQYLLEAALSMGKFVHISTWTVSLDDETKSLLDHNGFADTQDPPSPATPHDTVMIRSVDRNVPPDEWILAGRPMLAAENWDLREIYSDGS